MAVELCCFFGREYRFCEKHQTVKSIADHSDNIVVSIHSAVIPVFVKDVVISTFRLYGVVTYVSDFERINFGVNGS